MFQVNTSDSRMTHLVFVHHQKGNILRTSNFHLVHCWKKSYLDDCRITRNTFLYLSQVPVCLVSGRIGTMVTFFIPNVNPSKMICIHQFEWNCPHLTPIGNNTVNIVKTIHHLWKAPVLHTKTKSQIEDQLLFRYVN